jgi:uncharacterized protein (TIGR02266 family)
MVTAFRVLSGRMTPDNTMSSCPACGYLNAMSARYCGGCARALGDTASTVDITPGDPLEPGELFDARYEVFEEIGRGGMGVVYRCRDTQLDRMVAIKVLPEAFGLQQAIVARFKREARSMARLDHPAIVPVYGIGECKRLHYFVMKWLRGQTVATALEQQVAGGVPMASQRVRDIVAQVCRGLHHAHVRGLIHRDVKPGNVMIGPGERATLMDFGIVKERYGRSMTRTGLVFGTPEYMAPEQSQGLAEPSPTTDVYSVGVLAYEMLSGRLPFRGDTPYQVVVQHIHHTPPPLVGRVEGIEPGLEVVVLRALAKDPKARYDTALDMARALDALDAQQNLPFDADRRFMPRLRINREFDNLAAVDMEYASDVSSSGCFIRTERPLPVGTKVSLRFTLLEHDLATVEGEGEVARVESSEPSGMGVRFIRLTDEARAHIDTILSYVPAS